MKILLFGSSGQDGRILSEEYSKDPRFEVTAIFRSSSQFHKRTFPNVNYLSLDSFDKKSIIRLLSDIKPDLVVNLIGQSSVGSSFRNIKETYYANYEIPVNICHALKHFTSTWLFQASSAYIFDCARPIGHDSDIKAISPYAKSKASAYHYLKGQRSLRGRISFFHFFNHVSEYSDRRFLLPKLASLFLDASEDVVNVEVENISPIRNWGLSRDYMKVLKEVSSLSTDLRKEDFFVGSNLNLSVSEIISLMAKHLKKEAALGCLSTNLRPHDPNQVGMQQTLLYSQGVQLPTYTPEVFIDKVLTLF